MEASALVEDLPERPEASNHVHMVVIVCPMCDFKPRSFLAYTDVPRTLKARDAAERDGRETDPVTFAQKARAHACLPRHLRHARTVIPLSVRWRNI